MRQFNQSLPMLLLRAREATISYFRPVFKEFDITEAQWRVLRVLYEKSDISAKELAELTSLLSPSLTRILSRMESDGLISRVQNTKDLREHCIRLTPKGKDFIMAISPRIDAQYAVIREQLKTRNMESVYALLADLAEIHLSE